MAIRFNAEGYVPEYGAGAPEYSPQIDPSYINRALVERAYYPEYESRPIIYPDLPAHRRKSTPIKPPEKKPLIKLVRSAEIAPETVEDARSVLCCLAEVTRAARKRLKGKSLRRANRYLWEWLDEATQLKRELTGLKAVQL